MPRTILCFMMVLALMIGACASPTPLPPLPTTTPLPATETPTATTVWFPPTPTLTPIPAPTSALTATIQVQPQFGELILADDFDDPSLWSLGRSAVGSAALGQNELTLAVKQARGSLYSLRQRTELADFYAEITASPSICRDGDEYGLMIRVTPGFDFYRFSLTCDGRVRLDKYYKGRASSPQPPAYSGAVPPGAPSSSRLGVQASGKQMHFFVNGQYQFSLRDPNLSSGTLGVFTRAAGEEAVTVNFSELLVYQVER